MPQSLNLTYLRLPEHENPVSDFFTSRIDMLHRNTSSLLDGCPAIEQFLHAPCSAFHINPTGNSTSESGDSQPELPTRCEPSPLRDSSLARRQVST